MAYESFVRQEVLEPAGALRIGYRLAGWKNEDLAVGYRGSGKRWGTPLDRRWYPDGPGWNLRGNGGMLATAADLSRWYEALWQGKVLGKEALDKFMEIDARDSEEVGGKALGHAGGNGIFNCIQICYFAAELYLTVFSNVANQKAVDQYRKFREQLIEMAKSSLIV
jgi:CubicO group peptidase (beta-lactamase class C family)